ncbi:hypothetical protein Tco_0749385 [Tanacetum coccineum]|uniref:Uncharacterized protein n=1 Tax=Tanacetum coccineum TaxID=301880 RepID=A0ABQ4YYD2_9ASTR
MQTDNNREIRIEVDEEQQTYADSTKRVRIENPPYKFKWTERTIPVAEGSLETTTEGYMENYKNVSQDLRNQLDAEAEAVQIILIGIDNDIYFIVDAFYHSQNHPTHYTHNSSTRSQQAATRNRGKAIVNSSTPTYDQELAMVADDDEMSKEKEIDKLMALISLSFKKIYKYTNNNLRTSLNTSRSNQDNTQRINRGTGYDNQRAVNVAGARENVGTSLDLLLLLWKARIPFEVPGQMTYLVASLTLDSARSYVMQGKSFTQGTVSTIPFVGSISPEGFLPPILLLVVIIAMVVITVVVVVVVGGVPSIHKLSFMVIGFLYRIVFYYLLY